jgi:hypothetical protein
MSLSHGPVPSCRFIAARDRDALNLEPSVRNPKSRTLEKNQVARARDGRLTNA